MSTDAPRAEHPRPQFVRETWLTLNGTWEFEFDPGDSGYQRGLVGQPLSGSILVPFAPESKLSGIGDVDFHEAVWYRREITIPADWTGLRPQLHFGAVDHDATVWVDGHEVVRHRGGFISFTTDLTGRAKVGQTVTITVRARDPRRSPQARGKQATWYHNTACHYTRTTGIWQSVWLEGGASSRDPSALDHPGCGWVPVPHHGAADGEPPRVPGAGSGARWRRRGGHR